MANIAQSVNVISPLMTTKTGIIKQTTWWPYVLFSKYMRGWTVAVNVRAPEYEGRTEPSWIRGTIETPILDVSACVGEDGWVTVAVVNVDEAKDFKTSLDGVAKGEVQVFTVTGESVGDVNTAEVEKVGVKESMWEGGSEYTFPKASLTMLRWKA